MKLRLATVFVLITLTGCSLIFGGPKATVRKFLDAAKKGDVESMNKLFSSKAVQNLGADRINDNNRQFAEMSKRSHENATYNMEDVQESIEGNEAFVSFIYRKSDKTDSIGFGFQLSKEGGTWKIDNIGPRDKDAFSTTPSPSPSIEPTRELEASPKATGSVRAPISGGVLNGKATSLPKPPYPPIARAAKAAGTVVVQVTVDEEGNVISATPVSGHPLLRAAATAAARQAKFSPTKLSGQPVKVTGVLTYNFVAE